MHQHHAGAVRVDTLVLGRQVLAVTAADAAGAGQEAIVVSARLGRRSQQVPGGLGVAAPLGQGVREHDSSGCVQVWRRLASAQEGGDRQADDDQADNATDNYPGKPIHALHPKTFGLPPTGA